MIADDGPDHPLPPGPIAITQTGTTCATVASVVWCNGGASWASVNYVAFGRTVLPDLRLLYASGAVLAVVIVVGFLAVYALAPRIARFFPREVRRIGRLFREGMFHSFRALPSAGPLTLLIWLAEAARLALVLAALGLELPLSGVVFVAVASSLLTT